MRALQLLALAVVAVLLTAAPVLAQAPPGPPPNTAVLAGNGVGAGLGAAITILGAGYGFSRIGSAALESMARQPEVAGRITTAMIVIAALLEGATFFALIICIIVGTKAATGF